jgi:hypothetical protein
MAGAGVGALVVGLRNDQRDVTDGVGDDAMENDVVMEDLIVQSQFFEVGRQIGALPTDHPFIGFAFIQRLVAEGGPVSFGDFDPAVGGVAEHMVF